MGIDFIERRLIGARSTSRSGNSGGATNGGAVMVPLTSPRIMNGTHLHHQHNHTQTNYHSHVTPTSPSNQSNYAYHSRTKVFFSDEDIILSPPKENGHFHPHHNHNHHHHHQSGTPEMISATTTPSSSSPAIQNHQQHHSQRRSFLSYTTSPTNQNQNGVTTQNNSGNNSSPSITPSSTTPSTTATTSKPSRTLSVRNFSNFVKRLPSLSLSPSVRIASSLGFSSANSHSKNSNKDVVPTPTLESSSSGPQSLGCSGSSATLKRPTTVSFQKKKARPFSYAEPRTFNGAHQQHNNDHQNHNQNHNGSTDGLISPSNLNYSLVTTQIVGLSPKGKLENVGNGGATYNGHSVADLEARLTKLRIQQLERRKSLDFAISCVEPDPMCFSVEEKQQHQPAGQDVLGIYIKSVVKNGSADADGRLAAGDQLLSVDGQSLIGISQEEAAKYLVRTGPVVTLEVAKQAALYHGLATMLNQPSPELSRGKGDGQDLSYEEDDEFSGDDVELYEASGGCNPHHQYYTNRYISYSPSSSPYNYNNSDTLRSSCSSQTLVGSDSMHLLSPPRPSEDYLRRPTAFPHHLQIQVQDFSHKPTNQNSSCYSLSAPYPIIGPAKASMKLVRQLSFPQEEDEEEVEEHQEQEAESKGESTVVTQMSVESNNTDTETLSGGESCSVTQTEQNITIVDAGNEVMADGKGEEKCNENELSTSSTSTSSSSEITSNDRTTSSSSNSYSIPIHKLEPSLAEKSEEMSQEEKTKILGQNDKHEDEMFVDERASENAKGRNENEGEQLENNDNVEIQEKGNMAEEKLEGKNILKKLDRRSLACRHKNYPMLAKKAISMPQCCTFLTGIALSPTAAQSCASLIALGGTAKYSSVDNYEDNEKQRDASEDQNTSSNSVNDYDNGKRTKSGTGNSMSTSMLLTSFSLNDVSISSSKNSGSALRDSNYWSSNCSTRDDNSTLCSPESVSSATAAMMRASQSDSSLARWNESFDALSRRGLSESALGVPRVVGSSRLLKFLINTYTNSAGGPRDDLVAGSGNYNGRERGRKSHYDSQVLPTRSRSSDAILDCAFNAPRRMSERDLPSKILREQNQEMASDHPQFGHSGGANHPLMMQGRIHSSKSVPSLNSDVGPNNAGGPNGHQSSGGMNHSGNPQMVRSPGYNPNMNNSHGHQMMQPHGQLPNHMSENQNGHRYPQGYPNMSMTMQHGSKSSMMSGHMNSVDAQTAAMRSRSIQSLADPPHRPDIGNKQPSTPALHMQQPEDTERFYQNVGFYPPPPPPPTNPANMPVRTYIPYSNSTGNISSSAAFRSPGGGGNHISPHYPGYPGVRAPPPNLNASVPSNLNWQQQQQRINHTGHGQQVPPQQQQQLIQQNHGVSRDLLRQEAKMLEMQDELRRREERAALMMSKQQQQQRYNQFPNQQQRPLSGAGPPAPAPKPYRAGENPEVVPGRPPLPEEFKQPTQFSASMTEISKGAFSYNNGVITKPSQLASNPWDREAKEVEAKRRKEAAKYWRDQQIIELEQFPNKTPGQEEQLRALKLEREFQRRADEMQREDGAEDDEEEEEDDRKAMVRRLQEDLERTRISSTNGNSKLDPMEEERAKKIEEMRRKKLELEAAQAAEERLVREAAKRREEELRRQHQLMQQQNQSLKHQQQSQMHLQQQQQSQMHLQQQQQQQSQMHLQQQQQQQSQMHMQQQHHHQPPQPPQTLSYQSPYRASYTSKHVGPQGQIINQTTTLTNENHLSPSSSAAPPLPKSPPPLVTPYKSAMQQPSVSSPQKSPVTPPQSSPKPKSDKKSVSFNETVATNEPPASPQEDDLDQGEKVREDPNKFLSEATALLASPRSPDVTIGSGSTPGVIGAQEVYRDPRMRRLAEQQQKQQAANTPKPEKLTFKEKMRMFAMESGDIESPKDKVKVSSKQREIENPAAPSTGNPVPK